MKPLSFVVLGVGHSEAVDRDFVSAMVVGATGRRLLIDAGAGVKRTLRRFALTMGDIDGIYLTHLHGDACFGLERFAFESRYLYQKRHELWAHPDLLPGLWHGLLEGAVGGGSEPVISLDELFDVHSVAGGFEWDGVNLELFRANHGPSFPGTFGVVVGEHVVWAPDTAPLGSALPAATGPVFHDLTAKPESPLHSSRAALIAGYPLGVRSNMWLVGYEDDVSERDGYRADGFAGLAWPGQLVDLGAPT